MLGAAIPPVLGAMLMMTMSLFPVRFFQRLQADLADKIDKPAFRLLFWFPGTHFHRPKVVGDFVLHIHLPDLPHPLDSKGILLVAVRQHIPHQVFENILFDQARRSFGNL
jgi:hypothetical protein